MRDLLNQLRAAIDAGRPVVYCRLVETRGSTPQKAGALMLVYEDGSQAGTLGGGCVEAEVKRRALALLAERRSEISTFQLDSDYGWDDGLICGGRMKILVEPILSDETKDFYRALLDRAQRGEGLTQAVGFADDRPDLKSTASFLFDDAGQQIASLRAGDAPDWLKQELKPLANRPRAYAAQGVAFLPLLPRCRLLIVGGGHVGKAVADLAVDLDFEVWVYDDRADYVSEERFPRIERRITGPLDPTLRNLEITPSTYVLIVTRGHQNDEQALYHLVGRGARYVGLIGSRRKIKMIFEDLLDEGIPRETLAQVYAPLGISIGSQTVMEIAVSIAAELVAHRNLGHVPGRPQPVEIK
jgi:xanthine dehydrogenase accessory factor